MKDFGISGKKVYVIGAGGAALAVAYGIDKQGGILTIVNRSVEKGEFLAKRLNCHFKSLTELNNLDADIVINTTSVGMTPNVEKTPVSRNLLSKDMVVMDVVYAPLETRLLKEAREKGCRTIDGVSMFISQGAAQFELWTGITPDLKLMRSAMNIGEK